MPLNNPSGVNSVALNLALRNFGAPPISNSAVPVVSLSAANAASTITNYTQFLALNSGVVNNTNFSYAGFTPVPAGAITPYNKVVNGMTPIGYAKSSFNITEFIADSSQVEVLILGQGQPVRVIVDGVEIISTENDISNGTAQGGGINTITLKAGSSATNGNYNTDVIYITGGTGSGQVNTVKSYVGSTKVATMASNWGTTPDATSTYRVVDAGFYNAPFASAPNDGNGYYILFNFGASRYPRHFRVEQGAGYFKGVNVDSSGSVIKPTSSYGMRAFWVGDSFGEPTGTTGQYNGYDGQLCEMMGWELFNLSVGSTGIINMGGTPGRCNYQLRTVPPVNAWQLNTNLVTVNGTLTLTQGAATTGSVATNASYSTAQAAMDSAFGAGNWQVCGSSFGLVFIGLGSTATITTPMTMTPSGVTGAMTFTQYLGDITPNIQVDSGGNQLPFIIFVQGSVNDVGQTSSSAPFVAYYQALQAAFPNAIIIATGCPMKFGPMTGAYLTLEGYLESASAALRPINGQIPFLKIFNSSTGVGYLNGTTNIATPSGAAGINTDYYVISDSTHPSYHGHRALANYLKSQLQPILEIPRA